MSGDLVSAAADGGKEYMVTQTKSIAMKAEKTLSGTRWANHSMELPGNLLTIFVRLLVEFDVWMSEPAMTNRDRLRYDITEHQRAMYLLWL